MKKIITFCVVSLFAAVATFRCVADCHCDGEMLIESMHAKTINPVIPPSVFFAGAKVSLDRIDMYERFDRELTSLTYTHGTTLLTIKRANRFFPLLIPILKKNGVPDDLIYLACIESNLNIRAYSGAKAAGLWQFIPSTAKQYGLEVNDDVDERYDPIKATEAACRYLKKAFAKYGNWESVAASYNGGMGRISGELEKQGYKSAYDLYLTDETSRYMFRLLAMKQIMESPGDYGFYLKVNQLYNPVKYKDVEVNEAIESWPDWAKERGISYAQLREFNPWIRSKSLPNKTGKTYIVHIPEKSDLFRSTADNKVYNSKWISY